MKRPDSPILAALDETVAQLHAAEQRLAEVKRRMGDQARAISTLPDAQERIDLAIYAYWFMPEVSANDLAWAVTGKESAAALLKHAGPMTIGITCDGCGKPVPMTSRTQMKDAQERLRTNSPRWAEGYRVACSDCETNIFAERSIRSDARDAANEVRYAELTAMAYADYLKTPDWARSLQRHVNFARYEEKSNVLPCTACSDENAIGAYHKSLGRLGHEWSEDLILLGSRCLAVFMENGLVAGEPSSAHLISNCQPTNLEHWTSVE